MYLEAASIVPERIQYHPAGPPPGSGDPTSAQLPLGADWRDPITDREGFRLPGIIRIRRLGQYDETPRHHPTQNEQEKRCIEVY